MRYVFHFPVSSMKEFLKLLKENKQYKEIMQSLLAGKDCAVNGLWGSSANFFVAAIAGERLKASKVRPKLLVVVPNIEEADEDLEDLNTFLPGHTSLFPAGENIFADDF